ncbi:MAG TPA: hypothetical protein VIV58_30730 [Kofleriaceae bacterium]
MACALQRWQVMNLPIPQPKLDDSPVARCTQCGDLLPLARTKDRDPKERLLCEECAVENMPHTD